MGGGYGVGGGSRQGSLVVTRPSAGPCVSSFETFVGRNLRAARGTLPRHWGQYADRYAVMSDWAARES